MVHLPQILIYISHITVFFCKTDVLNGYTFQRLGTCTIEKKKENFEIDIFANLLELACTHLSKRLCWLKGVSDIILKTFS